MLLPTCPNRASLPAVLTCSFLTTLYLFFPDSDYSSLLRLKPVSDPSQSQEPWPSSCNYWNIFSELPLPSNVFHIDPKDWLCLQCRLASNGTTGGPVSCPIPITIFRYWHQSGFVCSSLIVCFSLTEEFSECMEFQKEGIFTLLWNQHQIILKKIQKVNADLFWYLAKLIQLCKIKKKKRSQWLFSDSRQWTAFAVFSQPHWKHFETWRVYLATWKRM